MVGLSDVTDNRMLWRQLIAELVGTFVLVAVGVAACISLSPPAQPPQTTSIALAFGLLVASIVQVCDVYFNTTINVIYRVFYRVRFSFDISTQLRA